MIIDYKVLGFDNITENPGIFDKKIGRYLYAILSSKVA